MDSSKKLFLQTEHTHIECTEIILEELRESLEYLIYNVKRYKIPVTLVMFYSQEDITKLIQDSKRLTDVLVTIKIGEAYFTFIYLLFTDLSDSDSFVKHVEYHKLRNIEYEFSYEQLKINESQLYNFINGYLFRIGK